MTSGHDGSMEVVLCDANPRIWQYTWRDLYVMVPLESPEASDMVHTRRYMEGAIARNPDGIGCVVVILPGVRSPTPEARQAIRHETDRLQASIRAHCLLVHASGFAASVAISVGGFMMRCRKGAIPATLSHDVAGCTGFMSQHLDWEPPVQHSAADVLHFVAQQVADGRSRAA